MSPSNGGATVHEAPERRIVVAVEIGITAANAVALGVTLGGMTGADVELVTFSPSLDGHPLAGREGALQRDARLALETIARRLGAEVEIAARPLQERSTAEALVNLSGDERTGLLVVGAGRHLLGRITRGGVVEQAMRGFRCPVAVATPGYRRPRAAPRFIAAAYVDTAEGRGALRVATALALGGRSPLRVISVVETLPWHTAHPGRALAARRAALQVVMDALPPELVTEALVLEGDPVTLLADASVEADLLVCGARGSGVPAGSTSFRLISTSGCPVLVVPRGSRLWRPPAQVAARHAAGTPSRISTASAGRRSR